MADGGRLVQLIDSFRRNASFIVALVAILVVALALVTATMSLILRM
jgi:hypothetical protein